MFECVRTAHSLGNPLKKGTQMKYKTPVLATILALSVSSALATDKPSAISASSLSTEPYNHVGMVWTQSDSTHIQLGSGNLINPRIVLTAAHVVFDSTDLTWYSNEYYALRLNTSLETDTMLYYDSYAMAGSARLSSYSKAVAAGSENTELSFNSDNVALYSVTDIESWFGTYNIRYSGEPSVLAEEWTEMLLGYPADTTYIAEANVGLMHQTGPDNWQMYDELSNNIGDSGSDSNSINYSLYFCEGGLVVYGGNSGGPLYVYDSDDGRYVEAGMILGGSSLTGVTDYSTVYTIYRCLDHNTQGLITSATSTCGTTVYLTPTTLTGTGASTGNTLTWTDTASGETGWQIRRNDGTGWTIIATAAANATSYTDTTAQTGILYEYAVRAIRNLGSSEICYGAWSNRYALSRGKSNTALATAIGAKYLYVTSGGDAPFVVSGSTVHSGKILNNQDSYMDITVTGPGVLTYTGTASCENTSGTDYLAIQLDGTTQTTLYSTYGATAQTITISGTGSHTVRFLYDKEAYGTANSDMGIVSNVSYYGSASTENIQGGVITTGNWRNSSLLGSYYDYGANHWIYASNLGYLYVEPTTQSAWTTTSAMWFYSLDSNFGWFWTSAGYWPWIWSYQGGWMYYMGGNWFYRLSDGTYLQITR